MLVPNRKFSMGLVIPDAPDLTPLLDARRQLEQKTPFLITDTLLETFMAVLGGTGSGKSRYLALLMRYLQAANTEARLTSRQPEGFCLIDPAGDLAEDHLAYVARKVLETGDRSVFKRVHYWEPSYEQIFHLDPFKFCPPEAIDPVLYEEARRAWLHAKADSLLETFLIKTGQMDVGVRVRLQRVLRNLFTAIGTVVDAQGTHLPLARILALLQVEHELHAETYALVAPFLDLDVRADFERLHGYRRVEDRLRETESSINLLRSTLSPILTKIFSRTENVVNFYEIIQNGDTILINLRKTPYFSHDQKVVLGNLLRREIVTTMEITPRARRTVFTLIIDEAGEMAGQDIERDLGSVRKYKLRYVLAGQDLGTFRKGEFDMVPKLLGMCGTVVCFQMKYPKDLDILGPFYAYPSLEFTPLLHEGCLPDGYDWLEVTEWSEQHSQSQNWGNTRTTNRTRTKTRQKTQSVSEQETKTERGDETTKAKGKGKSRGESAAEAEGEGDSEGQTLGGGKTDGITIAHKRMPLARHKTVFQKSGKLEVAVNDQFEKMKSRIAGLRQRQAIALTPASPKAFFFETHEVKDAFRSAEAQEKAIDWAKREIAALHPYYTSLLKPIAPPALEGDAPTIIEQPPDDNGPKLKF